MATTRELTAVRTTLLEPKEGPIIEALGKRMQYPVKPSFYFRTFGINPLKSWLYVAELMRTGIVGAYDGRVPLSKGWLPNVSRPEHDVTKDILRLYPDILLTTCRLNGNSTMLSGALEKDLLLLELISDRVHSGGKAIAQTKLVADRDRYFTLAETNDINPLMANLRDLAQESAVLERIREKARMLSPHLEEAAIALFSDLIMPTTLKAEAKYILAERKKALEMD